MEKANLYATAAVGAAEGFFRYYVRPEITAKRTWALIGGIVLAHEVLCPPGELLSEGADRLIENHPFLARAAGLMVAGHVLNVIAEDSDLIHRGVKFLKGNV